MTLPKGSSFLFGPRGTGKSTWIEAELPDALRLDLLETDLRGLRLFCTDYPEARGHLLYGGTRRYQFGQIEVIPFAEAIVRLGATLGQR